MSSDPSSSVTVAKATARVNAKGAAIARIIAVKYVLWDIFGEPAPATQDELDHLQWNKRLPETAGDVEEADKDKQGAWEVELSLARWKNARNCVGSGSSTWTNATRYVGARPHANPDAEDYPEHWAAAALAFEQRDALAQAAPSAAPYAPGRSQAL